jgi:hypothetical protein
MHCCSRALGNLGNGSRRARTESGPWCARDFVLFVCALLQTLDRALGNLGNALLAQGELKKALLDELRLAAAQDGMGQEGRVSLEGAEARLRWVWCRIWVLLVSRILLCVVTARALEGAEARLRCVYMCMWCSPEQ